MKMKEVIEKTGLTDRAVRLYIDEGLALPDIEESYSGRKSIDFSENDVERLKNVALLRKAGFSIADIKSIVDDNSTAKDIIGKFIEQTENNIAHETEIVKKLKGISFDEAVTLETICESLSATVKEKEVPKEDLKSALWNKIEKNIYKAIGIASIAITGIVYVLTFISWVHDYRHLAFTDSWFSWMLLVSSGWIIIDVFGVLLILLNRDKSTKRNKKFRRLISGTITILIPLVGFFAFIPTLFSAISFPVYSMTTDIKDYLVLDYWVENNYGDKIHALFPSEIPEDALKTSDKHYSDIPFTTKYYYKHSCDLDQFVDIVAEWELPANEFEKAKRIAMSGMKRTEQKGYWTIVYYREESDYYVDNYIFAYNDKQRKVRYITEITIGTRSSPYYLTLDW